LVCGFSFGARVGMELGIGDPRVKGLISIGTPIDKYDFGFLLNCRKPILFVHGELDEFGSADRLKNLVEELSGQTQVQISMIPGADHFFEGKLDELKRIITSWTSATLTSLAR